LLLATLLLPVAGWADVAPADWREQQSESVWAEYIRPAAFEERAITEGTAQNVLEIKAPFRAEDATVVPISIHTRVDQSSDNYIRRIHVYVDKNPLPLVGVFEFTPASGRADLAMRVRVDDFSFVRAIAEMNSGELYMAKSFVRATGACSAPPPKSIGESIAQMGSTRVKTVGAFEPQKPNLVQLQIKHPNITGLQPMKIGSRVMPPAHYVSELNVDFDGTRIMSAQVTFSLSMDPSLRFYFVPPGSGTMTVDAVDTERNHWTSRHNLGPDAPG
jgi:sulfur-oxidizing protein SoxY